MDALSEAFVAVRATGAIFFAMECSEPWALAVPDVNEAAHLMAPGTERIVNYHLVTEGRALVSFDDGETFWAESGDIVILPHGTPHRVAKGRAAKPSDARDALNQALSGRPMTLRLGGTGALTRIVCGFIGCGRLADGLFLSGLPRHLHINLRENPGDDWLTGPIQHLVGEAEENRPGANILLTRLAEALFVEALRRWMQDMPEGQTGWLAGVGDPLVGSALARLQSDPQRRWTQRDLASCVGASQSALNRRFSEVLGETPAAYLRRWRLCLAAGALRTSRASVLQIASDVGYQSEAAFNRAFKAEFDVPPARYRRQGFS